MKKGKDYHHQSDVDEFERKARKNKKVRSGRPQDEDQYADQHLVRPHHFSIDDDEFEDWQGKDE